MTWLRAHWRLAALLASHLGLGVAGWALHRQPPAPAVRLRQDTSDKKTEQKDSAKHDQKGAEDVVRRTFRQPPAGCPPGTPPVLASETKIHRAPSSSDTNTKARSEEQLDQHLDLRIAPAALARWALGAGLEDPLGARRLRLDAGMHLLGPVWLRAGLAPSRGLGSTTVGLEVQW